MFGSSEWENDSHIASSTAETEQRTIDDVNVIEKTPKATIKFLAAFSVGVFFFLFPIQWEGQTTIPLDIVVTIIIDAVPYLVELFTFSLIVIGGILTTVTMAHYHGLVSLDERTIDRFELDYWETSNVFWAFRLTGIIIGIPILLRIGPEWLLADATAGVVWHSLLLTITLVIPIGAVFVNLLAELGGL